MARNTKKRRDCFLGLHSDFHAHIRDKDIPIGATLNESEICEICEILKPDFIQIACKGHPGYTSYPTSFSNAFPNIEADLLEIWRRVTKKYGISLYMHYSGVYDIKYCNENPEEAVLNADGTRNTSVRLDSKYFDDFFIPQLSEIIEKYDVDGFWIDGDCWSVKPDYSKNTIERFESKTGIKIAENPPKQNGDAYFYEFMEFFREEFKELLNHYVDILHEKYPDVEICSNWAFSDHMPGKVCANVDFLSGDLNPENSFFSARYAGRMLASQGMPWDLMSWNFRFLCYSNFFLVPHKNVVQAMQEAAEVISLGGAFQDYVSQFVDGSHDIVALRDLKPLYNFLRARKPYTFKAEFVPQIAMLVSTYDRYNEMTAPFTRDGMDKFMGLTSLFCDSSLSIELKGEHSLLPDIDKYPAVVIPELYKGLEEETVESLRNYVKNGGNLILIGMKTCEFFAQRGFGFNAEKYETTPFIPGFADCVVGHSLSEHAAQIPCYFSFEAGKLGIAPDASVIKSDNGGESLGMLYNNPREQNGVSLGEIFPYGKGKIAAIGLNLGTHYINEPQYLHRTLIKNTVHKLFTPQVIVEKATGLLETVLLTKDEMLLIQLVNSNGSHTNVKYLTDDSLPSVTDIEISVKVDKTPKSVILQPENKELGYEEKNGRIYIKLNKVDIHSVIEII